jgi:hypothetical protein
MQRAVDLFRFEEMPSLSPLVTTTWRTTSEPDPEAAFISSAVTNWEIVVTRQATATWLTVRGPETRATAAPIPPDAEFFGIAFSLGTFMPQLDLRELVDGSMTPPSASDGTFWLDGSAWELPTPDNADVFVDRLVRAGLLVHDPIAAAALRADVDGIHGLDGLDGLHDFDDVDVGLSSRSVERRVARATGLTRGAVRRIRRAERAVELLGRGLPALEVARRAGYADQPHMTRSLKRFMGQTPTQIAAAADGPSRGVASDVAHVQDTAAGPG